MALYALHLPYIVPYLPLYLPISPLFLPYSELLMALYAVKVMASLRVRVGVRVRLMALYAVLMPYIFPYLPYTSPISPL